MSQRLLRPDVQCTNLKCRAYPNWRIYASERERYASTPPEELIGTIQCHRCGTVYEVRAEAIHRAA